MSKGNGAAHPHPGSPQLGRRNSIGVAPNERTAVATSVFQCSTTSSADETISVSVSVNIRKLISIDVETQTFTAEVFIRSSWVDKRIKAIYDDDDEERGRVYFAEPMFLDDKKVNCWSPRLQVTNMKGVPDFFESWSVPSHGTNARDYFKVGACDEPDGPNTWRVSQVLKLQATFLMKMKLRSFPLDEHYLEIRLKANTPEKVKKVHPLRVLKNGTMAKIRLAKLRVFNEPGNDMLAEWINRFDQDGFYEEWGWWASQHLELTVGTTDEHDSIHSAIYSSIVCRLHVVRDPWYYVMNVMLVHGAISTACLACFTYTTLDARIDSVFQLVTAAIANKFVASQNLPKLPHMTKLDGYIFVGLAMMTTVICLATYYADADQDRIDEVDILAVRYLGWFWAAFNMYYACLFVSFWLYGKKVNDRSIFASASRRTEFTPPEANCPCFRLALPWTHHHTLHEVVEAQKRRLVTNEAADI